jgi:DNA-binding winged helix-turn-helix (wHTH) protein/dipeptidyl aminopeptidase/acylaminoacyl peptidase
LNKTSQKIIYRFANFSFDPHRLELLKSDHVVKVEPQVAQLLKYFLENKEELLTRETIIQQVWPNRVVSDDALRSCIKKLRELLNDNAKSPQFIKTFPLKGYEFIGEVSVVAIKPSSARFVLILLAAFLLVVSLLLVFQLSNTDQSNVRITHLTELTGSELKPSFNIHNQHLIFSHRANKDDFLQLYVKDVESKQVTRLTWDEANYGNPIWSPSNNKFAYIRSTPNEMKYFISEYQPGVGITNTKHLDDNILYKHYLLGWSHSKNALYLTDKSSPTHPQGIWRFDIDTASLEQITSPNVPGQGDYFADESNDGEKLAILRSISLNKYELLVLHLKTGEILFATQLPKRMNRLVWNEQNSEITMGSFDGALLRVSLDDKVIENITPRVDYVNNLFYQCGDNCYLMRQHNGNYLDIAEQPNPFVSAKSGSFAYHELEGANDFPIYANRAGVIYYFNQYANTSTIESYSTDNKTKVIYDFRKALTIQSLAINNKDSHLIGLADSRLFLLEIESGKLEYLSKQTDITYPPHWIDNDKFTYATLKQNQIELNEYSLAKQTSKFVMDKFVAAIGLGKSASLLFDKDYNVFKEENGEIAKIGQLPSSQPNRFKIIDNEYIYYTGRVENTNILFRIEISTGKREMMEIAKNRYKANFDMSSNQEKLLIVESLLAQSDVIKLEL